MTFGLYSRERWVYVRAAPEDRPKREEDTYVGIMRQVGSAGTMEKGDFFALNDMKLRPGKAAEYGKFEREVWQLMVAEHIQQGGVLKGWFAMMARFPYGDTAEYDFITVDVFRDWQSAFRPQTMPAAVVSAAFPGKSCAEMAAPLNGLRTMVLRELFRVVEMVSCAPQKTTNSGRGGG